jgi:acetyltransferase
MEIHQHPLHKLFSPDHVAVIGAGDDLTTVNGRSLMLMLRHKTTARLYPVNPKRDQVQGLTCYKQVSDLPVTPDVAVLVIAQRLVAETLIALGEKGCPFAVVTASGYAESGDAGRKEQQQIEEIARRYGMRLVGPNCVGLTNLNGPRVLSWVSTLTRPQGELLYGDVALVSQSGAMLSSLWDRAIDFGLGYSKVISSGNEADLGLAEYLDYLALDPETRVVSAYIEGIKNPARLVQSLELLRARGKTLVAFKVGQTEEASRAAASHTGSLTGSRETFDALCRAYGVIQVQDLDALFSVPFALRTMPPAGGPRLGVFSSSGGAGGVIADKAGGKGLVLAKPGKDLEKDLEEIVKFPPPHNPLDFVKAPLKSLDVITRALSRFLADESVDIMIIFVNVIYFQEMGPDYLLAGLPEKPEKPVLACWMGGSLARDAIRKMNRGGIPTYSDLESCLEAARALVEAGRHRKRSEAPKRPPRRPQGAREKALAVIEGCGGRLDEVAGKEILKLYGVACPAGRLVTNPDDGCTAAGQIGYPVVAKGVTPDILHKTEAGLIRLNIPDAGSLRRAWDEIVENVRARGAEARFRGVLIERMAPPPLFEAIAGAAWDAPFHKIMFGLGGIWVEVLKDTATRLAPLDAHDAEEMLAEIKAARLLGGLRGKPAADREALIGTLLAVSEMVSDLSDRIAEVDLNPLMVYPQGVLAVDALITLKQESYQQTEGT